MKRLMIGLAVVAFAVSGCGSSSGSDTSSKSDSSTTAAPSDTSTKGTTKDTSSSDGGSSGCASSDADKDGFVRAFCDGAATVTFDIGGSKGEIGGGTCEQGGGYFTINAGTVVTNDWTGTKPDYAGFLLPEKSGDFTGETITASITTGGDTVILTDAKGTHDDSSASFTATTLQDGKPVTVTVTC